MAIRAARECDRFIEGTPPMTRVASNACVLSLERISSRVVIEHLGHKSRWRPQPDAEWQLLGLLVEAPPMRVFVARCAIFERQALVFHIGLGARDLRVAFFAGRLLMGTRQAEARPVVIEVRGVLPSLRVVASGALGR